MRQYFIRSLQGSLASLMLLGLVTALHAQTTNLEQWRAEREAKLKAEDGWLAVAGLFWLKEGENTIGTAPDNTIVLPAESAPSHVGVFELRNGKTVFRATESAKVTANGQPVTTLEVKSDQVKGADVLQVADLSFLLLKRGERFAIRLKDKNAATRRNFAGLRWYPAQSAYRVTARFIPYEQPREVSIVNILGDVERMKSPGYVVFSLHGQEHSLEPVSAGSDKLFFIFRDLTSGKTTYKPGRFLYTAAPQDGQVVLDFNQAINPPCAFTAFATCPLPPKRNHLNLAIAAGEQLYPGASKDHEIAAAGTASSR